ncbi:MAG: N-acetylglucosamine-6-phosphate deacetylase [Mucilaginibacter sp.]|uniref:N-acetylglucosamine-6-phosphate deacetylase n=1 Tax=Mucilaginibacter sp. TaxID=1882438 RepID=UPI002606C98C|nr:N-acetylglucosamine-6-phosphate deacetylase [Mucilaginibacter sp.]MDB5004754.1 N-acetylglucosamine-6-phosphate deacetylase [Mucilaginibacter sp.]
MITALHNLQLISDGTIASGKAVLLKGDQIIDVIADKDIPQGAIRIDLNNNYLAPGLVDLQVYGSGGKLLGSFYQEAALAQMEDDFLLQGTTGFLATIGTNSDEIFEKVIVAAKNYWDKRKGNFLGLHLEGPFLNPLRKGAHLAEFMHKASLDKVKRWLELGGGVIKMITIAPELQDNEVINYLNDQGVILSSGHSNATYKEGKGFLNKPVKAVTHLYNAMPQMHHRDPGYIPAIFEERPYTSIVADGVHVDFAMIRLAKRELGDKLFLITDAVTETTEGTYPLHELRGNHYVMPPHYTLSGSCLTMLKAVQNCVEHIGIELAEAINMASLYPAQLIGATNKGKIAKGFVADLIVFDQAFTAKGVIFKGLTKTT